MQNESAGACVHLQQIKYSPKKRHGKKFLLEQMPLPPWYLRDAALWPQHGSVQPVPLAPGAALPSSSFQACVHIMDYLPVL